MTWHLSEKMKERVKDIYFMAKKITFNFSRILATGIYNDTDNAVK
jgi:hypothetical protein